MIRKISAEQPGLTAKDRMKLAQDMWKAHKVEITI